MEKTQTEKVTMVKEENKFTIVKCSKVYDSSYTHYNMSKVFIQSDPHQTTLFKVELINEDSKLEFSAYDWMKVMKGRSDKIALIPESINYAKSISKYGRN